MNVTTQKVTLPSGAPFEALNDEESEYFRGQAAKYVEQFALVSVADLADLDLVLMLEFQIYRVNRWLSRRADYEGKAIDETKLRAQMTEMSRELRGVKKQLGIDKPTRDKTSGQGSPAQRIASVMARAKAFGIHRENQLDKALELSFQVIALVTYHRNANPEERRTRHIEADDVIEWLWTVYKPGFEEVDAYFREHVQRFWIRDQ